jgi:parallel beta-helix repeat protein
MAEVIVQPTDNLQALATAHPAGTVFRLPSLMVGQTVVPKDDQQFLPQGDRALLRGDGAEFAIGGRLGGQTGDRVVIRGLEITGYKPLRQQAAVRGFGEAFGWLVENCDIHHNANVGIGMSQGWIVRRCFIHHQGTLGMGGNGTNLLVEDCTLTANNTEKVDPGWEGGATKFAHADGLVVRRCWFNANYGMGLWTDGNIRNITVEDCEAYDNLGPGIFIEISHQAVLRRNRLDGNGHGTTGIDACDILIATSDGIEVCENEAGGIGLKNTDRSASAGGPYRLADVLVRDNLFRPRKLMGWYDQTGKASGIRFERNRYDLTSPNARLFRTSTAVFMDFAEWQTVYPTEMLYQEEPPVIVKPEKPAGIEVWRSIFVPPVEGAERYELQRKVEGVWEAVYDYENERLNDDPTHPQLDDAERGRYRVRAVNSAGVSPWSYLLV